MREESQREHHEEPNRGQEHGKDAVIPEDGPFRKPSSPEEEGFLEDEDGVATDPVYAPAAEDGDVFEDLPSRRARGDEGALASSADDGDDDDLEDLDEDDDRST